jgi:MOSC domain-containing protein YiiM
MPCYKLALRFDHDDMIHRFLESGRSGFYCAVLELGEVQAGSGVEIVRRDINRVTVADICRLYFGQTGDLDLLRRAQKVSALPQNWKAQLPRRARRDYA